MFKHSEDANVQELAIFTTPPTNTSVRNPRYNEHHPVSGITSVIHFAIKGSSLKYLDLRKTRLYVKCKIVVKNGNPPPPVVNYSDLTNIPPAAKRKKRDADSNLDDNDGDNL